MVLDFLLIWCALASSVAAHGVVQGFRTDGIWHQGYLLDYYYDQKNGKALPELAAWSAENLDSGFVAPENYTSSDIVCQKNGQPAPSTAKVSAGGTIEFLWTQWAHFGPMMTYVARCDGNCSTVNKMSLKWIKIDEAGIDFEKQEWAAREMVANNLTWTTKVPRSLSPGNYVFRHETIAVHGSLRIGGAQNYPQCFNVEITGSGTASPEGTLAAELYTPTDPGIFFNPYKKPILNYTIPGPALFTDEGHDESSNATRPKTYSAVNSSVVLSTPTAPAVHRTILMSGTHSEGKTSLYASTVDPATTATPTAEILEISSTPSVSIETTLPTAYLAPKVSATSTDAAELSKGTGEQAGNSAIDGAAVSSDTWTLESIIAWLQKFVRERQRVHARHLLPGRQ